MPYPDVWIAAAIAPCGGAGKGEGHPMKTKEVQETQKSDSTLKGAAIPSKDAGSGRDFTHRRKERKKTAAPAPTTLSWIP